MVPRSSVSWYHIVDTRLFLEVEIVIPASIIISLYDALLHV